MKKITSFVAASALVAVSATSSFAAGPNVVAEEVEPVVLQGETGAVGSAGLTGTTGLVFGLVALVALAAISGGSSDGSESPTGSPSDSD